MKTAYGKRPRNYKATAPSNAPMTIEIHGRHTLEQFSFELQKMIAKLGDLGTFGIEACTLRLKPLDARGQHIALHDEQSATIVHLDISAAPKPGPYREN